MLLDGLDPSRQASLALQGVAVLAVAAAALGGPGGDGGPPAELAALALAGLLAALHRPSGQRGAAAGVVAWPLVAAVWGLAAAAALGAATVFAADAARALFARRRPLGPPANWLPWATAAAAARVALAVVAAGLAAGATGGPLGAAHPLAAGTAAYLVIALLATAGERAWRRAGRTLSWRLLLPPRVLPARLLEAAAWALGAALVAAPRPVALAAVAAVAALAAEAARQAAAAAVLADRLGELSRVHGAGQRMVGGPTELASVVERIHAECANVVPFHWFQLEMLAGDDEEPRSWRADSEGPLVEGIAEPERHPPMLPGIHRRSEWRLIERLLAGPDGAVARLTLWCDPRRLEAPDLTLFEALLPQMATSIRQALLDREAREDKLTGAAVRRVLEKRLFDAFGRAVEEGRSLAVVMVDVDHFKRINDRHGHAAGDRALATVGAVLAQHKRQQDLLARYGGEEFTLLLEEADGPAALAIAERLRRAVAEIDLELDGVTVPLTVSAGVAAFPELHVKTPSELLLLADGALYEAKDRGRNRCLLHLGRARYRGPDGESVSSDDAGAEPPPPPRIFA
jgi:diguanylate cyclase (GGDEF)-like protein